MPIISGKYDNAVHVIHGIKDLVIKLRIEPYLQRKNGEEVNHDFKVMKVCINHDGPQDNPTKEDLENHSDPVIVMAFTDDEAIDRMIGCLQELRNAKIIYEDEENA